MQGEREIGAERRQRKRGRKEWEGHHERQMKKEGQAHGCTLWRCLLLRARWCIFLLLLWPPWCERERLLAPAECHSRGKKSLWENSETAKMMKRSCKVWRHEVINQLTAHDLWRSLEHAVLFHCWRPRRQWPCRSLHPAREVTQSKEDESAKETT